MTRIWYAARRRGLNMPYPVSVSLDYEQKGVFGRTPPRARDLLAGLGRFPDLSGVTDEALETLDFAHKEVLFREGTPLTGVMVLVRGEISLQTGEGEGAVEIARASPGEIFGESGMYGRQASSLSAVALEDCLVVRMAPDAISQVFEKSPVLAREVGQVVEARRSSAQAARESRRKT
jgi:CRP-like cAMP-binding protein